MYQHKPVFTYGLSYEKNHYDLLNEQGYLYNDSEQLYNLLLNFTPHNVEYVKLDEFTPVKVMEEFNRIFIK